MATTKIDARLVIGIDPGRSGGICALLGPSSIVHLGPMPDTLKETAILLGEIWGRFGTITRAIVEELSINPVFSRTVITTYARHIGGLEGILTGHTIPFELVSPRTWQSLMYAEPRIGHLEGKARSFAAAKILHPGINLKPSHRSRVDSDGMADAYLIARYGLAMGGQDDAGAA